MANDKSRKMSSRPKAKPSAAHGWDAPREGEKKAGKRKGNGHRQDQGS